MTAQRWMALVAMLTGLLALAGPAASAGKNGGKAVSAEYAHIYDTLRALRGELEDKRRAVIRETMHFDDAEAKAFWPLYDRYRREVGKLDDRRDRLLTRYLAALDAMTDARADALMTEQLAIDRDRLRLQQQYYRRFKRILPVRRAVRFFQLDRKLDLVVELNHAQSLPLVD